MDAMAKFHVEHVHQVKFVKEELVLQTQHVLQKQHVLQLDQMQMHHNVEFKEMDVEESFNVVLNVDKDLLVILQTLEFVLQ